MARASSTILTKRTSQRVGDLFPSQIEDVDIVVDAADVALLTVGAPLGAREGEAKVLLLDRIARIDVPDSNHPVVARRQQQLPP